MRRWFIQFEYRVKDKTKPQNLFPAGEPVGVLAATAMSNYVYKAILDATPSSNSSWELMKEILLCKVNFKNELIDRRVILYLNECGCGRQYCREKAAYLVKNQLKKVILKDSAVEFLIDDTFNENSPPTNDPTYISMLGASVYIAMSKGDKNAVRLMQGLEVVQAGTYCCPSRVYRKWSSHYCSFWAYRWTS